MKKLLLGLALLLTISAEAFHVQSLGWCPWNGGQGVFKTVDMPNNMDVQVRTYPSSSFVDAFTTPTTGSTLRYIYVTQPQMLTATAIQFRYRNVGNSNWSDWVGGDQYGNCWTNGIGQISSICNTLAVNVQTFKVKWVDKQTIDVTIVVEKDNIITDIEVNNIMVPVSIMSPGNYIARLRYDGVWRLSTLKLQ